MLAAFDHSFDTELVFLGEAPTCCIPARIRIFRTICFGAAVGRIPGFLTARPIEAADIVLVDAGKAGFLVRLIVEALVLTIGLFAFE